MSECRWSSDDHQCDLYVWHDVDGGWRSEVAGRRRIFKVPMPPEIDLPIGEANSPERTAWAEATVNRMVAVGQLVDDDANFDWLDLPEPEGGTSYWHATPGKCADNLERLRGLGFNVPQSAIDGLRMEHAEPTAPTDPAPTAADAAESEA